MFTIKTSYKKWATIFTLIVLALLVYKYTYVLPPGEIRIDKVIPKLAHVVLEFEKEKTAEFTTYDFMYIGHRYLAFSEGYPPRFFAIKDHPECIACTRIKGGASGETDEIPSLPNSGSD